MEQKIDLILEKMISIESELKGMNTRLNRIEERLTHVEYEQKSLNNHLLKQVDLDINVDD